MKKVALFIGFGLTLLAPFSWAAPKFMARPTVPTTTYSPWIASGGLGLTISPTLFMINPQLEYHWKQNLFVGPMVQLGLGDATLFTVTGTIRYLFTQNPQIRPSIEGGLGVGFGSPASSNVGVHIMMGMGAEYVINSGISVGTVVRANLCPPLDTFFVSWPIVLGRFRL